MKVRLADGDVVPASIKTSTNYESRLYELTFKEIDIGQEKFEAGDLFEAMTDLRKILERTGAQLLCAGARVDVYPSGMGRDMGGGQMAYVTQLGRPGRLEDLVDIFDEAAPEQVGTVQEQRDFHKRWIKSLQ